MVKFATAEELFPDVKNKLCTAVFLVKDREEQITLLLVTLKYCAEILAVLDDINSEFNKIHDEAVLEQLHSNPKKGI